MKFGEKIRKLRTEQGLTQREVAVSIGISLRAYLGYEQEGRYPRNRELYGKLSDVLGCDVNYLLSEDEEFISAAADKYGYRGKRQAERLVAELSGLFAGGELSESDKDAVMITLQKAYFDCKEDNKKYTPRKYHQES